jgi:hypothetical protein
MTQPGLSFDLSGRLWSHGHNRSVALEAALRGDGPRQTIALPMRRIALGAFMVSGNSMLLCRVAALLVLLGGCATTDAAGTGEKGSTKTTTAVPPNYRQLVAARILESTDRQKIHHAQISRPQEAWTGLVNGGNRPVVCAVIKRETPLVANARDCWLVTFQDGKVAAAWYSYAGCDCAGLSPFNEVVRRR